MLIGANKTASMTKRMTAFTPLSSDDIQNGDDTLSTSEEGGLSQRQPRAWLGALLLLAPLLPACVYLPVPAPPPYPESRLASLVPGVTSREAAIAALGQPDGTAPDDGSLIWSSRRRVGVLVAGGVAGGGVTGGTASFREDNFLVLSFGADDLLASRQVLRGRPTTSIVTKALECHANGLCIAHRPVPGPGAATAAAAASPLIVSLSASRAAPLIAQRWADAPGTCLLHLVNDSNPADDARPIRVEGSAILPAELASHVWTVRTVTPGEARITASIAGNPGVVPAEADIDCESGQGIFLRIGRKARLRLDGRTFPLAIEQIEAAAGDRLLGKDYGYEP